MFRIVFFCDDRKLADALRALMGLAHAAPDVTPVVNGALKNGKVAAAGPGGTVDLFRKYVKHRKLAKVAAPQLRDFCKSIGRAPGSYSHFARQLVDARVLKKHGTGAVTTYTLVK